MKVELDGEPVPLSDDLRAVEEIARARAEIKAEVEKRIIGQKDVIDQLLHGSEKRRDALHGPVDQLETNIVTAVDVDVGDQVAGQVLLELREHRERRGQHPFDQVVLGRRVEQVLSES